MVLTLWGKRSAAPRRTPISSRGDGLAVERAVGEADGDQGDGGGDQHADKAGDEADDVDEEDEDRKGDHLSDVRVDQPETGLDRLHRRLMLVQDVEGIEEPEEGQHEPGNETEQESDADH